MVTSAGEPVSHVVERWSTLWAEAADEADGMVGDDKYSHDAILIVSALLVVAERLR